MGIYRQLEQDFDAHVRRVQGYIRQPSVSADGNGIREMATMLRDDIRSLGASCELVETGGNPVVYGYLDAGAPKTILFYLLYDTQPVGEPGWIVDAFSAEIVDLPGFGPSIVGRGASNSKGPLIGFINVLHSIKDAGLPFPVNVRFMIEGEEEIGSRNLPRFIEEHKAELKQADCLFQPYFGQTLDGQPIVYCGFKGLLYFELHCRGGEWGGPVKQDIHAMHNAWIANPAMRLVQAVASMKGLNERTVMEGIHHNALPPTPAEERMLEALCADMDPTFPLRQEGALQYREPDLPILEQVKLYLYETTLNLDGIWGGFSGDGTKTVVPYEAGCKLDIRPVPDQDPKDLIAAVRRHLDNHGFADIEIKVLNSYPASQNDVEAPCIKSLLLACETVAKRKVEVWPRSAGAAPHYLFTKGLGLPVAFGGLGRSGRSHTANEFITVEGLELHQKGIAAFLFHYGTGQLPEETSGNMSSL